MKYFDALPADKRKDVEEAFKSGSIQKGPVKTGIKLIRFAGYRTDRVVVDGNIEERKVLTSPTGSWWFTENTYKDMCEKVQRLNAAKGSGEPALTFKEFAKARLALPADWNDMLHIYQVDIPEGVNIECLSGAVNWQRLNGKNRDLAKIDKEEGDNVYMVGGGEQYYFDPKDIQALNPRPFTG